ncbi:hypothetical protein Sjap_005548 [Stephania japonica]|uniref:Uncharacterized protein n=1 Tax=Stephania japonica TaxID=461633 RepID=A0AAP0PL86_9MAGN
MIGGWSKVVPGASPEPRRSQSTSVHGGAAVEFVVLIQVFSWCLGDCRVLAAARVTGGGQRQALVVHRSPNRPEAPLPSRCTRVFEGLGTLFRRYCEDLRLDSSTLA